MTDQDLTGSRRVTIMQVARHAEVSHQTVSRFLRFSGGGMKPATASRIKAAIAELDYRPNLAARAMRTQRTGRLAVVLPEGAAHNSVEILQGVTHSARGSGYSLDTVTVGGTRHAQMQRIQELLEAGLFEGILSLMDVEERLRSQPNTPPLRVFPLYESGMHGVGPLAEGAPIEAIIDRLAEWGHRHMLHLAGDYSHTAARSRRDAYLAATARLGITSHGVVSCDWHPEQAMAAILDLPTNSEVTAIIAANDRLAAGAIRGALQRGWRVPDDVSIVGFDEQELSAWLNPALTTVAIHKHALGRAAFAAVLATLRNEPDPEPAGPFMQVIWRDSTGPAPALE